MRLSIPWLSQYVDLSDLGPERIGEAYTLHVAEVDEVIEPGRGWPGVVVGRVRNVRPHPNADRLRLVTVEVGAPKDTTEDAPEVVCGAPNVAEGQKICFAPEGTVLPDGTRLKRRPIRGVQSGGMVLSERELGLSDEHEGILVLPDSAPVGAPVRDVLPAGAVLEVDNKAITTRPDLWGHFGAARELAAALGRDLKPLELGAAFPPGEPQLAVEVERPDLCPRYLGWRLTGIEVGPSPDWLRRRLEEAGQRSINNVVDLTNFIQLECGQPLHAFDVRQIKDQRIVVRAARPDESVVTLDGVKRTLPEGACLIADPERAVAIAGVMGLQNSEVRDDTTEIILEVANFEMVSVRRTAHVLDLRTDSATRFSKGLDPEGVPLAARRFFHLLHEVCPTAAPIGAPCDARVPSEPARTISWSPGFLGERLGLELSAERIDDILGRLGYEVVRGAKRVTVTVPSWRRGDTAIPEDLVEDVGRIFGYDKIKATPLREPSEPHAEEPERVARRTVREVLARESGLTEIYCYPFSTAEECGKAGLEPSPLRLANAEQPGLDLMSRSHVPAVLRAVATGLKYRAESALFVVQPVFESCDGKLPRENERVTFALAARDGDAAVLELKGAVEAVVEAFRINGARVVQEEGPPWLHPGRSARVGRGREVFGWFGEINPRVRRSFDIGGPVAIADLDVDALRKAAGRPVRAAPVQRYPTVPYDVAVVADQRTPASDVEEALRRCDKKLVRDVVLFDVYEGDKLSMGKRSLAFTLTFGAPDRTLDPDDVLRLRAAVDKIVAKRGWRLRES